MRFNLNPIEFNNWQTLHKLLIECFAYMDELIDPPSSLHKMTPASLRKKANTENLLLVHDADSLIACAYFDIRKEALYVSKVAVAQTHSGQGIANRIFSMAEDLARDNDKEYLELETRIELTDNHKAFGKMGFITTAHNSHAGYSRVTSITMQRAIAQL